MQALFKRFEPDHQFSLSIFTRGLALVYLVAFVSAWVQFDILAGTSGILPLESYVKALQKHFDGQAFWHRPSLFFLSTSDGFINLVHWVGMFASFSLALGFVPLVSAAVCWVCYLSICMAGQVFFNFQWDALLLEAGFLLLFALPYGLKARWQWQAGSSQSTLAILLFRLLLFKFMFSSGLVKLLSGDETWRNLTALHFHFFTQPLPNPVAWYAHQLPGFLLKAATLMMLAIELLVPFFVFGNRLFRRIALYCFVLLQLGIAATGNYGFFNLLSLVLCFCLFDDDWLRTRFSGSMLARFTGSKTTTQKGFLPSRALLVVASILLLLTSLQLAITCRIISARAYPSFLNGLMLNNRYGLFANMTTSRPEVEIEGSVDGQNWKPYHFWHKPSTPEAMPPVVAPHMPRVDWQMWFAALGNYRQNQWLVALMYKLLQDNDVVQQLFSKNPFQKNPPVYMRALLYDYTFARGQDRADRGLWWQKNFRGYYTPPISLQREKTGGRF